MSAKLRRFFFLPAAAILLSSCGGSPSPRAELVTSHNTRTGPTVVPSSTSSPAPTVQPTATPTAVRTLPPAAPLPGLVYVKKNPGGESQGLWIVQADGQAKQLSAKQSEAIAGSNPTALQRIWGHLADGPHQGEGP